MAEFTPKRLAEYDGNDAVLYFPLIDYVATVREYEDEDCDWENGYVALLVGYYDLTDAAGERLGDGGFYGYHNLKEWVDDEFGDEECWVISDEGFDSSTFAEMCHMLYEYVDLDLYVQIKKAKAMR